MTFQSPLAFLLILVVPLYYFLRYLKVFEKPSLTVVLSDWNGKIFEWKDVTSKIFLILYKTFLYSGILCAVIAFSDPVIKHQEKIYTTRGNDILFVIDTSPSMVAKDVNGKTRLQAAKDEIAILVEQNTGARCGIVAMGSQAAVVVPPTSDLQTFKSRLATISEGSMGEGSAIGTGISTAVYHLASSSAPKKCIVLFTDGENNAGAIHPETAADLAKKNNITLYVFGVGTKGTVPINYTDPVTGKEYSGYLNSDFDSTSLKKIAAISNGQYFETATVNDLSSALKKISTEETVAQNFTYKTVNTPFYQKFLMAAAALIFLGWFIRRFLMKYKKIFFIRTFCFISAYAMLILALLGFSWGTYLVPVQKNSNAVSFVFDISNSMMAKDTANGQTRLNSASNFAKKLLENLDETSASVVLAKGDGVTAIPLTEDYALIESLLDVLSPNLMTAPGTSLSKGILAAKNSFPSNISACPHIWVFTDGDDSDGHLSQSLVECIKSGYQVSFVGFGSAEGVDIKAGDGKTIVHSSLNQDVILKAIDNAMRKVPANSVYTKPVYINAEEKGSAIKLLRPLQKNRITGSYTTYETKTVNRYKWFLALGFFLMFVGVFFSEFRYFKKNDSLSRNQKKLSVLLVCMVFVFTGCSTKSKTHTQADVLKGTIFYAQDSFEKSAGEFLETYENSLATDNKEFSNYALYDLACVYVKQNEDEAALQKLQLITQDAPDNIKYSAWFNAGVIFYKNGNLEQAAEFFRKALEIDGTKIEAKINLELSKKQTEVSTQQSEASLSPISDSSVEITDMEKAVFEKIRENDKGKWKNSETPKNDDLSSDY